MPKDLLKDARGERLAREAGVKRRVADDFAKSSNDAYDRKNRQESADKRSKEIIKNLAPLYPSRTQDLDKESETVTASRGFDDDVQRIDEIEGNAKTKKDLLEKLGPTRLRKLIELGVIGSDGLLDMKAVRGHMAKEVPTYIWGFQTNEGLTPAEIERERYGKANRDAFETGTEAFRSDRKASDYRREREK